MTDYRVIGHPAGRTEGPDKTTGSALYAFDVCPPGTLWAKALRSPYPAARIRRVDVSRAVAVPGVRAVLTGADVAGRLQGRQVRDLPLLAQDVVRFAGEKVAAVAADDEETAQRAVGMIEVEYEEMTPLLDALDAARPGARVIHPGMDAYEGFRRPPPEPSNVFFSAEFGIGDVDAGFAEADFVFEDEYRCGRTHPAFFESRSCVVSVEKDGRAHVWSSNKTPFGLRQALALAVGVEEESIVVHPVHVGGDFGSKTAPFDEPLAYLLSVRTGRPVKMVMDQVEELGAGNPKHAAVMRVRTGVTSDGRITAHLQEMYFDSGGYAGLMPLGALAGVDRIAANWHIPNARFEQYHVYTNNLPGGYMRGPGEVQGSFAMESHLDEVARRLEMDPLEFRMKNLLREGQRTPMNELFAEVRAEETLLAAVERSGYSGPKRPGTGLGIAMCARPAGGGESYAEVILRADEPVVVRTPIFEPGTGAYTMFAQVAAEVLGVEVGSVDVQVWDTDAVPFDSGVAGSRTTRMALPAVHEAAEAALNALRQAAAEQNGWAVDAVTSRDGRISNDAGESVSWASVIKAAGGPISGRGHSQVTGQPEHTAFAAQVAEVEVDEETGRVTLLRFTSAHDVGTVINPIAHQGQINGAVVMGIGYALQEELLTDAGRVTTLSLADFKLPNVADVPELETALVTSTAGAAPYSAKAIGEVPLLGVAPAIANAIRDATGVRMKELPLTAERVLTAIRKRSP
ncbi:MAG: xanthine dehydrogenase family protein molybdopterin-binding subunit [Chloroflexota bacterium]|nr:xanthine dehydrogenase family protein molybdopterin-binding subunit [Chloroflexota bacterium]MDE2885027.1 xanthine dehydrogenase family protein molybdopterin-binding subunit [Chloroflexota bacterium]